MIRNQLPVLTRQVVDAGVNRAQRSRSALLVEVAAEALVAAQRSRPNELRQLFLFAVEARRHGDSPRAPCASWHPTAQKTRGGNPAGRTMRRSGSRDSVLKLDAEH